MLEILFHPFTSFWTVLVSTFVLVYCALTVQKHVRIHGRSPFAARVIKVNSYLYSFASLCFCLAIILSSDLAPESLKLWDDGRADKVQRWLYHFSKFYEYLDIIFVLASGGSVGLHFAFHHLTVSR
jgi:GNS1/SUR4 family